MFCIFAQPKLLDLPQTRWKRTVALSLALLIKHLTFKNRAVFSNQKSTPKPGTWSSVHTDQEFVLNSNLVHVNHNSCSQFGTNSMELATGVKTPVRSKFGFPQFRAPFCTVSSLTKLLVGSASEQVYPSLSSAFTEVLNLQLFFFLVSKSTRDVGSSAVTCRTELNPGGQPCYVTSAPVLFTDKLQSFPPNSCG